MPYFIKKLRNGKYRLYKETPLGGGQKLSDHESFEKAESAIRAIEWSKHGQA